MSNTHDRRAPHASRVPFDAMVEVGGALGPSFEAQAVNLSEDGMSLRTAYLPEVGQPITCRFDAGQGMAVVAAGEVLWKDDMGDGGEFGIRFTNLDAESAVALQRILGMAEEGQVPGPEVVTTSSGRKVRLHIDGLASPMRARIKTQESSGVTAYSELGFLEMGKPLELEDAASGNRRPAFIDRVEVEVQNGSRIPQLVVSLRYEEEQAQAAEGSFASLSGMAISTSENEELEHEHEDAADEHVDAASPAPMMAEDAKVMPPEEDEEPNRLKSALARNAAKVTPALMSMMNRAKVAAALLAARARARAGEGGKDVEIPMRRTTAPAPSGGLHAAGRKVVRGSVPDDRLDTISDRLEETSKKKLPLTKKKAAIIGSVGIAAVLVFFALKKPAPAPQLASAPPQDSATVASLPAAESDSPPATLAKPAPPPMDPLAAAAAQVNGKPGKATPFTNGPVGSHPTILKIKMDGNIEGIQGASQPTGFTVAIPNRKTMDPTNTLADKDPRIASINMSSEPNGSELSVSFKDGVPNYIVRAHGDTLELVLAKGSAHGDKAQAHTKKKKGKKH